MARSPILSCMTQRPETGMPRAGSQRPAPKDSPQPYWLMAKSWSLEAITNIYPTQNASRTAPNYTTRSARYGLVQEILIMGDTLIPRPCCPTVKCSLWEVVEASAALETV